MQNRASTQMAGEALPFRYDRRTMLFHWVTAVIVPVLWIIAQLIDDFPRGAPRVYARSTHILLGLALAIILAARILWRGRAADAAKPVRSGFLDQAASYGHVLLYALAILAVLSGMANAWFRGDSFFDLFVLRSPINGNKDLRQLISAIHSYATNTLLIVAVAHAALALFHFYVLRDQVLARMLPIAARLSRE
jgi:cytochrome b561